MDAQPIKLGIVGLGRWAKVLARAAAQSDRLKIVACYSRTEEKRRAFAAEFGMTASPDLQTMLADPDIRGVIVTTSNEQHLPIATEVAKAGKHVYTEKPIAATLEDGIKMEALETTFGVTVTVGHSARLMGGVRRIRQAIDAGELGRIAFMEANVSNERGLTLTPDMWRWYRAKAPGGPLSQLAIHALDILHYLGGEIAEASSMAAKLSPAGAEVDDQSMTLLRFTDGKLGYVGSSWTSPGVISVRVFGSKGLMHSETDFASWDEPARIPKTSALYIQRGKDGFGRREELTIPDSHMFKIELEMFADSCRTERSNALGARNGNVAMALVDAALRSIEKGGRYVLIADILDEARARAASVAA
jgi:predicted dehydrogenase